MSNPNKAKGSRWEAATRDFLNVDHDHYHDDWRERSRLGMSRFKNPANLLNVRKPVQEQATDVSDLHAWPFVIQCKDVASLSVPKWLRAAKAQSIAAGFPYYCAAHKTRGKGAALGRVFLADEVVTALDEFRPWDDIQMDLNTRFNYWRTTLGEFSYSLKIIREGISGRTGNP